MNVTPFPNQPSCDCEHHQRRWVIFLKAWGVVLAFVSLVLGVAYGGIRLIGFLCDRFGTTITLVVLGVLGVSSLIGLVIANEEAQSQERQKRECKTHNV